MGFSRQEYWSGLPCPSPGDLPNPGTEPGSPTLQTGSLLALEAPPKIGVGAKTETGWERLQRKKGRHTNKLKSDKNTEKTDVGEASGLWTVLVTDRGGCIQPEKGDPPARRLPLKVTTPARTRYSRHASPSGPHPSSFPSEVSSSALPRPPPSPKAPLPSWGLTTPAGSGRWH